MLLDDDDVWKIWQLFFLNFKNISVSYSYQKIIDWFSSLHCVCFKQKNFASHLDHTLEYFLKNFFSFWQVCNWSEFKWWWWWWKQWRERAQKIRTVNYYLIRNEMKKQSNKKDTLIEKKISRQTNENEQNRKITQTSGKINQEKIGIFLLEFSRQHLRFSK